MDQNKEKCVSKIGFVLAAAGSATRLGKIWKFLTVPVDSVFTF